MSQQLNPNTILPMSLEVDRIHQINEQQPANKQALTAEQLHSRHNERQQQVNTSSKTEQKRVSDNNSENKGQAKNEQGRDKKRQQSEKDKKDNSSHLKHRGQYIDVNI